MPKANCYVLVYSGLGRGRWFFKSQNLYLGTAELTDSLEEAKRFSLDDAEATYNCMGEPEKWEIWSIRQGWVLAEKSERHIVRRKREQLLKELASLPDCT